MEARQLEREARQDIVGTNHHPFNATYKIIVTNIGDICTSFTRTF
jgi:hypothetical protein